jgi:hypothetical protein
LIWSPHYLLSSLRDVLQPVVTAAHINPNILPSTYWYSAAYFNLYVSGKTEGYKRLLFLRERNFDSWMHNGTMHTLSLKQLLKLTD